MCHSQTELAKICSIYYIGYGVGIILCQMPDKFGRKRTMQMILPLYVLDQYIILYRPELYLKRIGYFLQGFLHLRLSNSITHMLELISPKHWNPCVTMIAGFDSGSIGISCFMLLYLNNNIDYILRLFFMLSTFSCVLYQFIVPESPKFLIM